MQPDYTTKLQDYTSYSTSECLKEDKDELLTDVTCSTMILHEERTSAETGPGIQGLGEAGSCQI